MFKVYEYKGKHGKTYYFQAYINGKTITRRGFSSSKEAREAALIFIAQNQRKQRNSKSKTITWSTLCSNYIEWIKDHKKVTYVASLKRMIQKRLLTILPDITLDRLTYAHFKKARDVLAKDDAISIDVKNDYLSLLKRIFEYSKIYLNYEVIDVLKLLPFTDYSIKKLKIEKKVISFSDFKKIYYKADDYYKLVFLTFYLFGIRLGELQGLLVDSFDFDSKTMQIYRAVSWKSGGGFVVIPPKSKTSKRLFYLPDFYIAKVKEHIERFSLNNSNHYIFFSPKSRSRPLSENALRTQMNKICKAIDSSYRPHMFRHTNVSELYDRGLSIKEVQQYEGHSSETITKDVYLHHTDERIDRTLKVLNDLIKEL